MSIEAYNKKEKGTILVGMTGGVDSTVTAYLLKKQGFKVIGIGILYTDGSEPSLQIETNKRESSAGAPFGVHFLEDINKVKSICDELEIPFYGVHAKDRYMAMVEDFFIAARLAGMTYSPLVFSTKLIIEILFDKMKALKADFIATGNYGKISLNQSTGSIVLMQSNDLLNDETFQLARVPSKHAAFLKLPLADMRKKEVSKIYDSLKLKTTLDNNQDKLDEILFMEDPRVSKLVELKSPKSLRKEGSLINYMEDSIICSHEGVHQFFVGQDKLKGKGHGLIDQKMKVIKIDPKLGNIYLSLPEGINFTYCELKEFESAPGQVEALPVNAYVKFRPDLLKVACSILLGNNNSALLEFKEEQVGQLVPGQFVVLYDREGEGARVIGSGIVERSGFVDQDGERRELPKNNSEAFDIDEEEKPVRIKGPFKF